MTNRVLLNNVEHHDLRLVLGGQAPGDAVNQMLIFPTEFEEVQREFPIFFRRGEDGAFQSVALLGLNRDENLFLGPGGWQSRYIPALQQRGPFSIGLQEQEVEGELRRDPMIHIDLDDPRVSRTEGEPLFLTHGGNSPLLDRVADVLRTIYTGIEVAKTMFATFEEFGLIEPVTVEIQLSETERYNLPSYHTIGEESFARLDGASLERLHHAGFLRAAFAVLSSLGNVPRLIDLKNRKRAGAAGPEV